jgi:hypothetical protein
VNIVHCFRPVVPVTVLLAALAGSVAASGAPPLSGAWAAQGARGALTATDIQRLEDAVADASRDISQMPHRDESLSSALDDIRDETTYLKVKLKKGESVARTEYFDLRDRVDDIRARARGGPANASRSAAPAIDPPRTGSSSGRSASRGEIPIDTEFDVRLQTTLSSKDSQVEDRFEATTMVDLRQDDEVLVPAGSVMRGVVNSVNKAGRLERKGSLTLEFNRITVDGRDHDLRATVTQALESEGVKGEAGRIGAGAGVGAIIGGILGGFKGAIAGILIGGGGTIAATEGKDVELPTGTVLRVRLDSPLDLR